METSESGLSRKLGLFDTTMMMVGIIIGSGIFLTTGLMAREIPSAGLILLAWLVGGFLTLAGALAFAELGAAMPEAGGQYVYLREAYGPLSGFLFGWITFLVYIPGSIAALSAAFAEYFGYFFPTLSPNNLLFSARLGTFHTYSLSAGQMVAVAVIVILSAVHYVGVGIGKTVQDLFTVVKIVTILGFVALGLSFGQTVPIDYTLNPTGMGLSEMVTGFAFALIAVSWAFDGWNNINFVAGEIKNPQRNLPFALVYGTLGITALYLLINYVYLSALTIPEMAGVVRIAEKATSALYGRTTAGLISVAVIISVTGSLNGTIFVGPRVYYAMARDKLFFRRVAEIHPRFKTPAAAIVFQTVWACCLALSGTFEQLLTFAMFAAILFWIAAVAAVFTLRKKRPDLPRPYKTWGYPLMPILFVIASVGILLNTLFEAPVESFAGIGITLIGIPVYYYWKKKRES